MDRMKRCSDTLTGRIQVVGEEFALNALHILDGLQAFNKFQKVIIIRKQSFQALLTNALNT